MIISPRRTLTEEAVASFYWRADPDALRTVFEYEPTPKIFFPTQSLTQTVLNDVVLGEALRALCDESCGATRADGTVADPERYVRLVLDCVLEDVL